MVNAISFKKIGAVIQARASSTRLPDKIFLPLPYYSKMSVLENIIKRVKRVECINEIIVATTNKKKDDATEKLSKKLRVNYFRGNEKNVLSRFYHSAKKYKLGHVLRLTADNPCIDNELISSAIKFHLKEKNDYTATKNYPVGMNVEMFSFECLRKTYQNAKDDCEKEHVTPYIFKNHPEKFKISFLETRNKFNRPDIRLTLDTQEDYALLCMVYDYLYNKNAFFTIKDIVNLFNQKPWLALINKNIIQKKAFYSLEDEIALAIRVLDFQELKRASSYLKKIKKELHYA